MPRATLLRRVVVPILLVVLAGVGYALFVTTSTVDYSRMSTLVVEDSGLPPLKSTPARAAVTPVASSAFAAVKKAAATEPSETAAYGIEWTGVKSSDNVASMIVYLLPTAAQAATAASEASAQYVTGTGLSSQGLTKTGTFTVPSVSGSAGAAYSQPKTSSTPANTSYAVVFGVHRVMVVEYLQSATGALTQTDAVSLAQSEAEHLRQNEPGFTLVVKERPFWPSVIYWGVVAVVILVIVFAPEIGRRSRRRRLDRQAHQHRSQYRSRGHKTVRRQRVPTWAQRR